MVLLCHHVQRIWPARNRLRLAVPKGKTCSLEKNFFIDLIFRDCEDFLRIVHTATWPLAATFLDGYLKQYEKVLDSVWPTFITTWRTVCPECPHRLRKNKGFILTSQTLKQQTNIAARILALLGVRAQRSLAIREQLHVQLRRRYRKMKVAHPLIHPKYILYIAIKGTNNKSAEDRLLRSRSVRWFISRSPVLSTVLRKAKEYQKAIKQAQAEMTRQLLEKECNLLYPEIYHWSQIQRRN